MLGRAAADWLTLSPDGRTGTLDVRCTLETDDSALIFMYYGGRMRRATAGDAAHLTSAGRAARRRTEDPRAAAATEAG